MGLLEPAGRHRGVRRRQPLAVEHVRTARPSTTCSLAASRAGASWCAPTSTCRCRRTRAPVVTDDGRIRASLPVLTTLLDHGARVIVAAHLGRPEGGARARSTRCARSPIGSRSCSGRPVEFALDTVGESARLLADGLGDGELLLLENVRFNAGETSKDDAERHELRASSWPQLTGGDDDGGAFVEDAFGAVHRKHASVYDVATLLPHYCGNLVATSWRCCGG